MGQQRLGPLLGKGVAQFTQQLTDGARFGRGQLLLEIIGHGLAGISLRRHHCIDAGTLHAPHETLLRAGGDQGGDAVQGMGTLAFYVVKGLGLAEGDLAYLPGIAIRRRGPS